ncbi:MAG: hypothetical protein ACI3XH_06160 [Phascolarctobacterium sp.]
MNRVRNWSKRKIIAVICGALVVLCGSFFGLCQLLSGHAAQIFNNYMAKQKVLVGTVTAEQLAADLWGNVYFTNLRWANPAGETIIAAPKARLQVRPWDIVWRKASLDSIKELELEQADLHIGFDRKMRLDILRQDTPLEKPERSIPLKEKLPQNLKLPKSLPNITLLLKDTTLTAHYRKRLFILNHVDSKMHVTGHELLHIKMSAGKFGGSMVGEGLNIDGTVQLQDEQRVSLNIGLYDVVPASLGLSNANDPMTITGEMKGTLPRPEIDGSVALKQLHIPGLSFTRVQGNYHYANGLIALQDVTGSIFGGTLEAYGLYHFDNRHYQIDVKAKDLMAAVAAKNGLINCQVDLDIKFRYLGKNANNMTYGSFKSGKGTVMFVPFNSISGKFNDQNKELSFHDVVISTDLGDFESNAFKVVKGKVIISDIFWVESNGQRTRLK